MSWDPIWEKIHEDKEWGSYPSEPLVRFVASNFLKKNSDKALRMLEIGCGTGANLWFLAREGIEIFGVEGAASAVARAQQKLDNEVPDWRGAIVQGDIINLPFEDNFFDAVIDIEAVTHNSFDNSKVIYDEAHRVLRPGGKLFSQTFSTGSWGDQTGTHIEENGWIADKGPMSLGEFIRFTPYDDLSFLFASFDDIQAEKLSRTLNNRQHEIIEWLVVATKTQKSSA